MFVQTSVTLTHPPSACPWPPLPSCEHLPLRSALTVAAEMNPTEGFIGSAKEMLLGMNTFCIHVGFTWDNFSKVTSPRIQQRLWLTLLKNSELGQESNCINFFIRYNNPMGLHWFCVLVIMEWVYFQDKELKHALISILFPENKILLSAEICTYSWNMYIFQKDTLEKNELFYKKYDSYCQNPKASHHFSVTPWSPTLSYPGISSRPWTSQLKLSIFWIFVAFHL